MVRNASGRRFVFAALIGCLAMAVSGCGSTRPEESPTIRSLLPMEAIERRDPDVLPAGSTGYEDPDGVLNILALSGGGAYGAFGAGVLAGWTETGTRPEFDIVTGVSTGALISVFAFLGSDYDPQLSDLYTNVTNTDIFVDKGTVGFLDVSLYDNDPLKKQIEQVITPDIIEKIAAEHAKGRRLYVATTNLDSGDLVVWDMGDIASGGRTDPAQHFRKVLRASAAVPGFFPPEYIKPQRGVQLRQAHADGGVKSPVLLSDFLFRSGVDDARLYVVINDVLADHDPFAAVEASVASIAQKSISIMLRELLLEKIYRGYVRALNSDTAFFLTSIPPKADPHAGPLNFDPSFMRSLFDTGKARFSSQNPWDDHPPGLRSFDAMHEKSKK